jgi:hypothetical protein
MRRKAVLAGMALLVVLTGCGQEFGGPSTPGGQANEDPGILRTKIHLLTADECFKGNLQDVYPRCGKFITQLDSTTGSVDKLLAPRSKAEANAAQQLRSGVDTYQRLGCDRQAEPGAPLRRDCPATLRKIHDSLDVLASG